MILTTYVIWLLGFTAGFCCLKLSPAWNVVVGLGSGLAAIFFHIWWEEER